MENQIYQMKITLDGSEPAIWRRFLVEADMPFADFHAVLQTVMGWEGSHLYEFAFENAEVGPAYDDFDDDDEDQPLNDEEMLLSMLFEDEKKCKYVYDFGDNWVHTIQLEKTLEADPGAFYPACTAGARACPPEDCGGINGYYSLLEILADPSHPEYEQKREWLFGSDDQIRIFPETEFNPEEFDLGDINSNLNDLYDMSEEEEDYEEEFEPPTMDQWRRLYELADRVKNAKPWEQLYDSDYIAVKAKGRPEPVYYVTMGYMGECVAVAAYPGDEAIATLEKMRERTEAEIPLAGVCEQDCVICYYGDREELQKEDREILKKLEIKFRGKGEWVYFRSLKPGYAPWFVNAEEAELLCDTMVQYLEAYDEFINSGESYFNGENIIVREYSPPPSAKLWTNKWTPLTQLGCDFVRVEITDELYVAQLKKNKKTLMDLELDTVYMPTPIQEYDDERPYYPRIALLAYSTSGVILSQKIIAPYEEAVNTLLQMIIDFIGEQGIPRSLHVRDDEMVEIVEDLCEKLGIELKKELKMPAIDEAVTSMIEYLGNATN